MSIGLIITVLILSAVLGLLAKQTLTIPQDHQQEEKKDEEANHSHAI